MDKIEAVNNILKLKDGESWTWPESDYGRAEIWLKHGLYFLFEIPVYGGIPSYIDVWAKKSVPFLVNEVISWT